MGASSIFVVSLYRALEQLGRVAIPGSPDSCLARGISKLRLIEDCATTAGWFPPASMQELGMIWLWRLIEQPRRLLRRNLDAPVFLWHVLNQRLRPPAAGRSESEDVSVCDRRTIPPKNKRNISDILVAAYPAAAGGDGSGLLFSNPQGSVRPIDFAQDKKQAHPRPAHHPFGAGRHLRAAALRPDPLKNIKVGMR